MAEIIEKRLTDPTVIDKTPHAYKYYVHFEGMDKRLDKWVTVEDTLDPSDIPEGNASGDALNLKRNDSINGSINNSSGIKRMTRHA